MNHSFATETRALTYIGKQLDGTIDHVRIWHDVALSAKQIDTLYNSPHIPSPTHVFEFRGASTSATTITDSYDSSITAELKNGAFISALGVNLDGVDDYLDLTPWEFGGATTVETYVNYSSVVNTTIMNFDASDASPTFSHEETVTPGNNTVVSISPSFVFSDDSDWTIELEHESTPHAHLVMLGYNGSTRFYFGATVGTTATQYRLGLPSSVNIESAENLLTYNSRNIVRLVYFSSTNQYQYIVNGVAQSLQRAPSFTTVTLDEIRYNQHYSTYGGGETNTLYGVRFWNYAYTSAITTSFAYDNTNIGPAVNTGSHIHPGDWVHLVSTIEGNTIKNYVNGTRVETRTDGVEPTTLTRTNHMIGGGGSSGTDYNVNGIIAHTRMWNGYALNEIEVSNLYNTVRYENIPKPHHEFEFRNSGGLSTITDTYDSSITATMTDGAVTSAEGVSLDGIQRVNLTAWPFGGEFTIEVYMIDEEGDPSPWRTRWMFNFSGGPDGPGGGSQRLRLRTHGGSNNMLCELWGGYHNWNADILETNEWVHYVIRGYWHSNGTFTTKVSKNGTHVASGGGNFSEHEYITRPSAFLGGGFKGKFAYFRMWNGISLSDDEVKTLYVKRESNNVFNNTTNINTYNTLATVNYPVGANELIFNNNSPGWINTTSGFNTYRIYFWNDLNNVASVTSTTSSFEFTILFTPLTLSIN